MILNHDGSTMQNAEYRLCNFAVHKIKVGIHDVDIIEAFYRPMTMVVSCSTVRKSTVALHRDVRIEIPLAKGCGRRVDFGIRVLEDAGIQR